MTGRRLLLYKLRGRVASHSSLTPRALHRQAPRVHALMQELARLRDAQEQLVAWQEEAKFAEAFSLQLQASLDEVQRSSLDGQHGLLAALRVDQEAFEAHAAAMTVWSSDVARVMNRLVRRMHVIEAQACTALEQLYALLTTLCAAAAARQALLAVGAPATEWTRPVLAALELLPPALQPLLRTLLHGLEEHMCVGPVAPPPSAELEHADALVALKTLGEGARPAALRRGSLRSLQALASQLEARWPLTPPATPWEAMLRAEIFLRPAPNGNNDGGDGAVAAWAARGAAAGCRRGWDAACSQLHRLLPAPPSPPPPPPPPLGTPYAIINSETLNPARAAAAAAAVRRASLRGGAGGGDTPGAPAEVVVSIAGAVAPTADAVARSAAEAAVRALLRLLQWYRPLALGAPPPPAWVRAADAAGGTAEALEEAAARHVQSRVRAHAGRRRAAEAAWARAEATAAEPGAAPQRVLAARAALLAMCTTGTAEEAAVGLIAALRPAAAVAALRALREHGTARLACLALAAAASAARRSADVVAVGALPMPLLLGAEAMVAAAHLHAAAAAAPTPTPSPPAPHGYAHLQTTRNAAAVARARSASGMMMQKPLGPSGRSGRQSPTTPSTPNGPTTPTTPPHASSASSTLYARPACHATAAYDSIANRTATVAAGAAARATAAAGGSAAAAARSPPRSTPRSTTRSAPGSAPRGVTQEAERRRTNAKGAAVAALAEAPEAVARFWAEHFGEQVEAVAFEALQPAAEAVLLAPLTSVDLQLLRLELMDARGRLPLAALVRLHAQRPDGEEVGASLDALLQGARAQLELQVQARMQQTVRGRGGAAAAETVVALPPRGAPARLHQPPPRASGCVGNGEW